jgi:hypothetical protein
VAAANALLDRGYGKPTQPMSQTLAKVDPSSISDEELAAIAAGGAPINAQHIDPADAATELLKRRSIRCSLTEWARYKGFEPVPHHQLIIGEIQSFLASDEQVLLLFAPPGSAKSTYVSVLLPSWYLANNPSQAG